MNKLLDNAKLLRKNMTLTEKILWSYLRAKQFKGIKFRKQAILGERN